MLVSRLLEYPDKAWFSSLAGICGEASLLLEPAGYGKQSRLLRQGDGTK